MSQMIEDIKDHCESMVFMLDPRTSAFICGQIVLKKNKAAAARNLRRFTRPTNGHRKSLKHHTAIQAILFAW